MLQIVTLGVKKRRADQEIKQLIKSWNIDEFYANDLEVLAMINDGIEMPSKIAKRLLLDPPTVTRSISSLEHRGLIMRFNDQNDKRVVHLMLTSAGKRLAKKILDQAA